jgi:hypothetical protein
MKDLIETRPRTPRDWRPCRTLDQAQFERRIRMLEEIKWRLAV